MANAAVARLRDECVAAKEALSSDTEVSIPVLLPNVHTEVRLTRAEFEAMIRPALGDTLVVLRRALRSAGVEPADLHSVLLVGGSSRIPLISQMVSADLGRPVALDIHPKHSVAMGAADDGRGAPHRDRDSRARRRCRRAPSVGASDPDVATPDAGATGRTDARATHVPTGSRRPSR